MNTKEDNKELKNVFILIQDEFLKFLYKGLFEINGFVVFQYENPQKFIKILKEERLCLVVLGMVLKRKSLIELIDKILLEKIPVLILDLDEIKGPLENCMSYAQYSYVDVLNDKPRDIIKKARRLIVKYRINHR